MRKGDRVGKVVEEGRESVQKRIRGTDDDGAKQFTWISNCVSAGGHITLSLAGNRCGHCILPILRKRSRDNCPDMRNPDERCEGKQYKHTHTRTHCFRSLIPGVTDGVEL